MRLMTWRLRLCLLVALLDLALLAELTLGKVTGDVAPRLRLRLRPRPLPALAAPPPAPPAVAPAAPAAPVPRAQVVASGAPLRTPFRAVDLSEAEFLPVFIEEELKGRKNFRIFELERMNLTVEDPSLAVFYLVCCGPLERLVALPPRAPERPYMCYDCDAKLRLDFMLQPEPRRPSMHVFDP